MTEIWDIELDGFDALMKALVSLYPEVVADEMYTTMEKSLAVFHQAVVVETPVNLGTLRAATAVDIVSGPIELVGRVVNPLIYAWPVERGRRPGKPPPPGPIAYWLYRKGIVTDRKKIRSAAYLVARAIGRRGTKGAGMFWKGFEAGLPHVEKLWDTLPDRIVKRLE